MYERLADSSLIVDEIFATIQGESTDMGKPTVFLRLFGCNVGCKYCDQKQDPKNRKVMSISKVLSKVRRYGIQNVCITGGEPLLQWNACYPVVLELLSTGYNVSIETSGCIPIELDQYHRSYKYVMDVKCPSSGVVHKNVLDNLMVLQAIDEVKFVISDRTDYDFMKSVLKKYSTPAKILISPCFDENMKPVLNGEDLFEWLMKDRLFNIRVQIQMHKVLNVK